MPYCPVCGSEVLPDAKFCPKCGASLVQARPPPPRYEEKYEKREKEEKREKAEKEEKYEKAEAGRAVQIAVGLIILILGVLLFITTSGVYPIRTLWPFFLLAIGIVIIVFALAAGRTASRRSPRPS